MYADIETWFQFRIHSNRYKTDTDNKMTILSFPCSISEILESNIKHKSSIIIYIVHHPYVSYERFTVGMPLCNIFLYFSVEKKIMYSVKQ